MTYRGTGGSATDGDDGMRFTFREVVLELNRRFDALDTKLDVVLKDFNGFERRMALHEQLSAHAAGAERLAAMEHDVRGLMASASQRQAIESYLQTAAVEAAEQRRNGAAAWRWAIGLGIGSVLELATLLLKVFGLV